MDRHVLRDLAVFEAVARHGSFTSAAAELGISQSSISYAVTQIEKRIGIPLLARTTRNVSPTEAGQRLLDTLAPALRDIADELVGLQDMRDTVSGSVRLTMVPVAFDTIVRPALNSFRGAFPNVKIEVSIDEGLSDIVSDGFDGGIRFNTLIEKDMVSTSLTKETAVSIVASPDYLRKWGVPTKPDDLAAHTCIGYRFVSSTRLYRWPLKKGKRNAEFGTDGGLVFNDGAAIHSAALDGLGLAYLFTSQVRNDIEAGKLVPVLTDWLPPLPGFSLYYPSRARTAPAFRALIEHLRKSRS